MPAKSVRKVNPRELAKRRGNPLPPGLADSIIQGAGFAAGTAMAMPIIEGSKQLFRKAQRGVKRAVGIRNPGLADLEKQLKRALKGLSIDALNVVVRWKDQIYDASRNEGFSDAQATEVAWTSAIKKAKELKKRNPGSLSQADEDKYYGTAYIYFHNGGWQVASWIPGFGWNNNRKRSKADALRQVKSQGRTLLKKEPKGLDKEQGKEWFTNPGSLSQAESLSEQFHGREPLADYFATDELQYDANLADIGALVELSLWTGKKGYDLPINFTRPYPRLASSADGQQLYIVGGDQSLDNASLEALKKSPVYAQSVGTNRSKRKIPIGTLVTIVYKSDKHHLKGASGGMDTWEHHFGEDTRKQPMLVYDTLNRKMEIVGGDYVVKDVGIVN